MAHPGDVLRHPTSGRRLIFRRTSAQTRGRLIEYDVYYTAAETRPPEHAHADQEHQVELLGGSLQASVAGRLQHLHVGDVLLISAGEAHAIWNAAAGPAHAVWHTFPARDAEAGLEANWLKDTSGDRDALRR